jgi:hypothetical protein
VGVGRKDYSQNAEFATEALARSHLERAVWSAELTYDTPPYPWIYGAILQFTDAADNVLLYVPNDIKHIFYDMITVGEYHSLIVAALQIYSWPDFNYVETVGGVYGYGRAELRLTKGHVCEPGRAYVVAVSQWSEKPISMASVSVYGMTDRVIG